ncbi:MAG: polyhydroxyalkanoic acid system family protein [Burkholderiaceae bacterium]
MSDIHLLRNHHLGLEGARSVAARWADKAQRKLEMACAFAQTDEGDELQFSRPGVKGTLLVNAERFELRAELGFLFSAFKDQIEREIAKNLDELLANNGPDGGPKASPN